MSVRAGENDVFDLPDILSDESQPDKELEVRPHSEGRKGLYHGLFDFVGPSVTNTLTIEIIDCQM